VIQLLARIATERRGEFMQATIFYGFVEVAKIGCTLHFDDEGKSSNECDSYSAGYDGQTIPVVDGRQCLLKIFAQICGVLSVIGRPNFVLGPRGRHDV
jgi:hypothetical protein